MGESNYNSNRVYNERRRKRKKRILIRRTTFTIITLLLITLACITGIKIYNYVKYGSALLDSSDANTKFLQSIEIPDWIDQQIIHVHNSARSGAKVSKIKNIVIHYVGNPRSTAQNNRDYFDKNDTEVSAHFVVGLEGEIIQCVPLYEKSAASNWRNKDTISIEVCHPDIFGKFNDKTYASVIKLSAWLCNQLKLNQDDLIRHYDITGKMCPKYYVDHEDAWVKLKSDVGEKLKTYEK